MSKAIFHWISIIYFLGPKIKDNVPTEFEELVSLSLFKKATKNVNLKTVQNIGFFYKMLLNWLQVFPITYFTALFY